MNKKVIVTDSTFPSLALEEAAARAAGAEFKSCQCKTDQDVAKEVKDADVVVLQFAQFGTDSAKEVKSGATILRYGVGYDTIDIEATKKFGLKVGYVPDYCVDEVADHTSAFILALLRKCLPLDNSIRQGIWSAVTQSQPMKSFSDTTVGFFGMGQMGRAVKFRLDAFGFKFQAYDPALTESMAKSIGVKLVDSEEMIRSADIITLHAPSNNDTIGFFNMARFETMKPTAMIVNSARGNLIVEDDLAKALIENKIAGAALDVFEEEPLPQDSLLRSAPRCLLTPHAAWYSDSAINRLQGLIAEDITRALNGLPPRKPVPGTEK